MVPKPLNTMFLIVIFEGACVEFLLGLSIITPGPVGPIEVCDLVIVNPFNSTLLSLIEKAVVAVDIIGLPTPMILAPAGISIVFVISKLSVSLTLEKFLNAAIN